MNRIQKIFKFLIHNYTIIFHISYQQNLLQAIHHHMSQGRHNIDFTHCNEDHIELSGL